MIEIKNRFTGEIIHSGDFQSVKECLLDAIENKANLQGANLRGANLWDADLRGANLQGANLWWCAGNKCEIKSLWFSDTYPITYTSECMQIGCEQHKIAEWWDFDDKRILKMDGKTALKFWRENKDLIKQIIDANPAKPTGKESSK